MHVIGLLPGYMALLGGVLIPNPDTVLVGLADANGASSFSVVWPSLPLMLGAWFQFGAFDAGAVQGASMSNAVQAVQ